MNNCRFIVIFQTSREPLASFMKEIKKKGGRTKLQVVRAGARLCSLRNGRCSCWSAINYCHISTTPISASARPNESLFSCRFSPAEFFCALSHAPTHSSLRSLESGADLKWSGWTPLSPRKTKQCVRIPKPAGDVRKISKWGNKSPVQSTHLKV